MATQSKKWNKLARIHDTEREVACRAYLDLIAGRRTEEVELALKLNLGSAMLIEVPYILELMGDAQGKRVLDAGCGGGFYSLWLSERGAKVLGIDVSKEMIRIAKRKASSKMLDAEFMIGDVSDLGIEDGTFDLVLSTLVLMDVKELDKAVSELVRVTRDGGILLFRFNIRYLLQGIGRENLGRNSSGNWTITSWRENWRRYGRTRGKNEFPSSTITGRYRLIRSPFLIGDAS